MGNDGKVVEHNAGDANRLHQDAIGVGGILFFVIAAAAPLTVVVGVPPLVFGLGENLGAAGAYLLAGIVLFFFSVGYAAMSTHVSGPGGFAVYVAQAFGPLAGAATAFLAVVAYYGFLLGTYGLIGFLAEPLFLEKLAIDLPWWVWSGVAMGLAGVLGYRDVHVSARVLGVLLVAEILLVLIMDFAIILDGGASGLSLEAFEPSKIFMGATGLVILFAFASFVGFEGTTIYGEEARDRRRTVPKATYLAVLAITAFYVLTFWAIGIGYGHDSVIGIAQDNEATFVFDLGQRYVGSWAAELMNWLVLGSIFAATLAFHNALSRYVFAMGRNSLLHPSLGRAHRRHRSPAYASLCVTSITALVVGIFALVSGNPYLGLYAVGSGVGTVGVLLLYTSGAVAVVGFLRFKIKDERLWQSLIAPVLATAGLLAALYLAISNFTTLTASTNGLINALWLLPFAVVVIGYGIAWLRYRGLPHDAAKFGLQAEEPLDIAADLDPIPPMEQRSGAS